MDSLNEFKKYIEAQIKVVNAENSNIEKYKKLESNLDLVCLMIENGESERIDKNILKECLDFIYDNEKSKSTFKKLKEAIELLEKKKENPHFPLYIPQLSESIELLSNIKNDLEAASDKLSIYIDKIITDISSKNSKYEEYINLVKDGSIVRHLNEEELQKLFIFLEETSLSRETILELTLTFTRDSLDYAEKLRKLKIAKEVAVKKKKATQIKEKIEEKNRREVKKTSEIIKPLTLTEEEKTIYSEILSIVDELEKDINLTHDALADLLIGDYTLESRISNYDSTDNKFNLILEDLKTNLIPNFNNNKEGIIIIFKHIIHLFDEEYKKEKEEVPFISQIPEFTEQEIKEIEKYLSLAAIELETYNKFSDTDKNMISSMEELIKNNDTEIEASSKFSFEYVIRLSLLRKLHQLCKDYLENRKDEKEYVKEGLQEDINSQLTSQMEEIREVTTMLNKTEKQMKDESDEEDEIIEQYEPNRKTVVIFLPLQDGNYSIVNDQAKILEGHNKEAAKSLRKGLYEITRRDFYTYISGSKSKDRNIKNNDHNNKGLTTEVKPYRFRKNDVRFAYTKLSLTPNNQKKIKEAYNLDNADVLLILGCSEKQGNSNEVYRDINNRIAGEIENIRHIFNLFGKDFDDASFKEATTLIDDSDKYCERLYKEPFKKIDDESWCR